MQPSITNIVQERSIEFAAAAAAGDAEKYLAERRARQSRDRHWTMLCAALFVIAAAFALDVRDAGTVAIQWPIDVGLPATCASRAMFGVECPGCGLTRSFVALSAGDIERSVEFHRVGWLLALAVVAQIPYRIYMLRKLPAAVVERAWTAWTGSLLIALLVGNWLLKMAVW
jgi:Protein of unknown function (DUF2752)